MINSDGLSITSDNLFSFRLFGLSDNEQCNKVIIILNKEKKEISYNLNCYITVCYEHIEINKLSKVQVNNSNIVVREPTWGQPALFFSGKGGVTLRRLSV